MRARRYLSSDRHGTLNNHLLPLSLQRSLVDDKPLALYYLSHLESPEEVHIKDLQGFPDVTRRDDERHAQAHVEGLSLIHISEPTRLGMISYAVFCLKKKKKT